MRPSRPIALLLLAAAHAAVAAGPLVIDKGGTYRGEWSSDDPAVPVVRVTTRQPVVIEHSTLRGRGPLIVAEAGGADLVVRDTVGTGINPNVLGRAAGRFLQAEEVARLTVEHCELDGTAGIYVYRLAPGGGDRSIRVVCNLVHNIDGRRSDGQGGYLPFDRRTLISDGRVEEGCDLVQFVQLNGVARLADGLIAWNQVFNEPGRSRVEDNISIYESSGTPDHPLLIQHNCIVGGYTVDPAAVSGVHGKWRDDWDYSGGGIMLGDGPGKTLDTATGYLSCENNLVLRTSNYGIGVSSGHDTRIVDNRVIASGQLPDGRRIATQNVGIYVWDMAKGRRRTPPTFFGITGTGNVVAWAGRSSAARNDWWVPDAAAWTGNVHLAGPIDEEREISDWVAHAARDDRTPGVRR